MAIKSLLTMTKVDRVGNAHNCQANSKHRLQRGDIRLGVRNGRSWDHYCSDCALKIIERDMQRLAELSKLEPAKKEE